MLFSLLTSCPPATALETINIAQCVESLGQIQKLAFVRLKNGTTKNSIPVGSGAGGVELLATWTALKAATDSTKVVISPFIQEPSNEAGGKREYGGGNATLGGIPITLGSNPSPFTAKILHSKQSTIAQMKKLCGEGDNLGVYLIDEHGRISGTTDDHTTPTVLFPIPVRGLFIGDKVFGNFEGIDYNDISFSFLPNWSDMFHVTTPSDFDALTELDA